MAFSYSFHISSKGHAIGTIGKLGQVSKHNLRSYKSNEYDKDQISVLAGSETSILDSVKKIYKDEFSDALKEYNSKKRADRQINDYLEHVSQSRNDVAAEIIIQIGDKEFWQDKTPEQFRIMDNLFREQLKDLEKLLPEFKIASAVVHYDESSPHMHIVGIPVAKGGARGMRKQCVKTKVFTSESLVMLQEKMRSRAAQCMESIPELFKDIELKEKEEGRNRDYPKYMMDKISAAEKELYSLKEDVKELQAEKDTLKSENAALKHQNAQITAKNKQGRKDIADINKIRENALNECSKTLESNVIMKEFIRYTQLDNPKTELGWQVVSLWKDFSAWFHNRNPEYNAKVKESVINKLNENRQTIARREPPTNPEQHKGRRSR